MLLFLTTKGILQTDIFKTFFSLLTEMVLSKVNPSTVRANPNMGLKNLLVPIHSLKKMAFHNLSQGLFLFDTILLILFSIGSSERLC